MNGQTVDSGNGRTGWSGNGQKVARRSAATVLALVAAGLLYLGVGLAYAVPDEYGMFSSGDTMADIVRDTLLMGAVLGLVAASLWRAVLGLLDRRRPPAVVLVAVVLVTVAAMVAAGVSGRRNHDAGVARASTACTPARVAVFTEVGQPFQTASAPFGERDGSCTDEFVVRGDPAAAGALFESRLRDLGWIRVGPDDGPDGGRGSGSLRHYVRRGVGLTVRDDDQMAGSGHSLIRATLG